MDPMLQSLFSNDKYTNWTYLDMINAINFLLDNIYVCFGNTVYPQVVVIPMATSYAPLIGGLFLYCYESQFMAKIYKDHSKHDLTDQVNKT